MLLNHVRLKCNSVDDCEKALPLHAQFQSFFAKLLGNEWLSEDALERFVKDDEETARGAKEYISKMVFEKPSLYPLLGLKARIGKTAPSKSDAVVTKAFISMLLFFS